MNMMKKALPVILILSLLFSTTALVGAAGADPDNHANNKLRTNIQERLRLECPVECEWGQENRIGGFHSNVSDEIREQMEDLRNQLDNGSLSREEFLSALKELVPGDYERRFIGPHSNLPAALKVQIEELRNRRDSGAISCEEFQAQIKDVIPEDLVYKAREMKQVKNKELKQKKVREQILNGSLS